ncbi:hypothetical protein B0F90DRAFT_1749151 [Multifurca ochricompacta]|uniref:Zn(2)-C6 fungal-type domain-containing protein n=1 Tax=Multifurca ochricompacta TaxID=376703 RepID=A0AAD4LZJ7_9AGAM|nr:hypothetical protein B0F90DRAFT_1749151 [Multifurca ochricompacta]
MTFLSFSSQYIKTLKYSLCHASFEYIPATHPSTCFPLVIFIFIFSMDSLRFVLEAPQLSQTHKKRPRLVTSCDNCRLKKIKCVQVKSQPRCEACETGNTPCQFRDRERYFAERSRIVTGASAGSSPAHSRRSSSSQGIEPSVLSPTRADSVDPSGWYSATPASSDSGHPSRYASSSPPYSLPSSPQSNSDQWFSSPLIESARPHYERQHSYATSSLPQPGNGSSRGDYAPYAIPDPTHGAQRDRPASQVLPLFDSRQVTMPHPTMLIHLVQVFFEYFSRNFPFLQYDDISRRVFNGTLSPLLANSITSLSARYSQSSDVLARGATAVSNAYADTAKRLLHDSSHVPYIEILHAVIILAWAEYKAGRVAGPTEYSQMATKLAMSLGLGNDVVGQTSSERERTLLRSTWTSVVQLQQIAASRA